jgi:hypothetical protein
VQAFYGVNGKFFNREDTAIRRLDLSFAGDFFVASHACNTEAAIARKPLYAATLALCASDERDNPSATVLHQPTGAAVVHRGLRELRNRFAESSL